MGEMKALVFLSGRRLIIPLHLSELVYPNAQWEWTCGFWPVTASQDKHPPPQAGRGTWMTGTRGQAQAQNSLGWQDDGGGAGLGGRNR